MTVSVSDNLGTIIRTLEAERVLLHPRWELSRGRTVGPGPTEQWMAQEQRDEQEAK